MKPFLPRLAVASFLSCLFVISARAVEPAAVFSDHMVLQRGIDVPVWGTAEANAEVTVSFAGNSVSGKSDADGKWRLMLPAMAASAENRVLTVSGGGKGKEIQNVLVGDVWIGSGQSNMAGKVASYAPKDPTLAALVEKAPYPQIRLANGGPKPSWKEANQETIPQFSALLIAFGERLHQDLDVPIGLIVGAVGGTPSGAWMPAEIFESSEACQAEIAEFAKTWDREKALKQYEAKVAAWEKMAEKAKAAGEKVRGRKPLPPADPGESSRGRKTGGLFDQYIRSVSGYAIRGVLWDQGEAGSGIIGLGQYTSMSELIRGWRELWGQGEFPFLFVQKPSGLGNAFSKEDPITREADAYTPELPDIAKAGNGDERFLYTRLMRDIPNAWMVPAIDLGAMIHPLNKWGYGNRAAQVAEQKVYEMPEVQAYGPIYDSHAIDGNRVTVTFHEAGKGLTVREGESVQGFALAGEDGQWHWAEAEISGENSVILTSGAVSSPKQVRFAWAKDRTWANLFNQAGLPALAFSTEVAP